MAEMEAKLRIIMDDRIQKLVLPPQESHPLWRSCKLLGRKPFGISDEFILQYLYSQFEDHFSLYKSHQIKHTDTIKVVCAAPILLNLLPLDEGFGRSFGQLTIQDEFHRITMSLESQFMGGTMGLRLQAILLKDADEDSVSHDLAVPRMKIYNIRTITSEGPDNIDIVLSGAFHLWSSLKNNLRITMVDGRLRHLGVLSIESRGAKALNMDDFIKVFASQHKNRRIELL